MLDVLHFRFQHFCFPLEFLHPPSIQPHQRPRPPLRMPQKKTQLPLRPEAVARPGNQFMIYDFRLAVSGALLSFNHSPCNSFTSADCPSSDVER